MTITTTKIDVGSGKQKLFLNMYAYNNNGTQSGWFMISATNGYGACCTAVYSNWSFNSNTNSNWGSEMKTDSTTSNYVKYGSADFIYVQPNYQNYYGYITFGCNFSQNTTVTVTSIGSGIGQLTTTQPNT
jgi:hypothetical protein